MKNSTKLLWTLIGSLTALAGAIFLIVYFWDKILELFDSCCYHCASLREKGKNYLSQKMPWKRTELDDEFADYAD